MELHLVLEIKCKKKSFMGAKPKWYTRHVEKIIIIIIFAKIVKKP